VNEQAAMAAWLERRRLGGASLGRLAATNALLLGVIAMVVVFSTQSEVFFTAANIKEILLQSAILGMVAVIAALLLLSGNVDLSVGSVLGLGGVVTAVLMVNANFAPVAAVAVGLAAGALVGAVNGYLIAYLRFSGIIVTLGMLTLLQGINQVITEAPVSGFGDAYGELGRGTFLSIPIPVVVAAVTFAIGGGILTLTPFGRHIYAIGVNREAAYVSGIAVRRVPFVLYVASGLFAALGGVVTIARLDSAPPGTLGVGFELNVLTAVLLGGIAFDGGRGRMSGVLLGVLFLGVLNNGLTILNVPFYYQLVAQGGALIIAAALDRISTRHA
jgi:ribose transport system permease protein